MDNQKYLQNYEKTRKGDAEAIFRLGEMYEREDGENSVWTARKLSRQAARFGYAPAYLALGNIIAESDSIALAADFWFLAAEKGCTEAMLKLGDMYKAEGMPEAAEKYYRRAAENDGQESADDPAENI